MYKYLIRPILFLFDPEKVHYFTFDILYIFSRIPGLSYLLKSYFEVNDKTLERELFGIKFPNPVGLAAGLDKNGVLINEFSNLGFGFIEIGTLTPKPQDGNEKPRLFRLKKDKGIINRMGFNNHGIEKALLNLKKKKPGIIVGGNIGKNKLTPNEEAVNDYLVCFDKLHPYVDYFVVNVSSPNTPGLRDLQEKGPLTNILRKLKEANAAKPFQRPILLKIAPDLSQSQLNDIIEIMADTKIDGLIATNTTISRENLTTSQEIIEKIGAGGLSGMPLRKRSTEVIRYISENSANAFPIIAVGGIHSPEDALEKLNAGASLVQLYTGFVYEGPALIKKINKALTHLKK